MDRETTLYGISVFLHSLIVEEKLSKKELNHEIYRIIDEMYKVFKGGK
jgi:hypothetical protein